MDSIAFCTEKGDLRILLDNIEEVLRNYRIKLNKKKIKVMSYNKLNKNWLNTNVNRKSIEQMQNYSYLGSEITEFGKRKLDTISRMAREKKAFQNVDHLLTTNHWTNYEYHGT